MPRHTLSCALLTLTACAARPAAIEPLRGGYQFKTGDVLRYRVASILSVDMEGTHPDFLPKGMTQPLAWDLEGEFDNEVLDIDESGVAQIERRVKDLKSSGQHQGEKFGLTWNREKDRGVPDEAKVVRDMDQFLAKMISLPPKIHVDARGVTRMEESPSDRLIMRQGMMYWPARAGEVSWSSSEEIAVPLLHHKITLKFSSSVTGRSGTVARITAPASFEISRDDVVYSVAGGATVEFDESSGRLKKLELDLLIRFTGKAPVAGGGDGVVTGAVTYKETQVLVE